MPYELTSAAGVGIPSKEAESLGRIEGRARWAMVLGVALVVVGVLPFVATSSHPLRRLGFVALVCALGFISTSVRFMRVVARAREALKCSAPQDFLLERKFRLSRSEAKQSRLWAADNQEKPVAWFNWQWADPMFMTADMASAQVYGDLTRGAVVVASCPKGVLVGRIKWSHFDAGLPQTDPPPSGGRSRIDDIPQ